MGSMPQMWVCQALSRWVWSHRKPPASLPTQCDCFQWEGQACYHTICLHKSMLGQPLTLTAETMPVWILIYTAWCVRAQTLINTLLIKTLYLFTARWVMYWEKHPPRTKRFPSGGNFAPWGPRTVLNEGRGRFISQCMRADLRQNTAILSALVGNK